MHDTNSATARFNMIEQQIRPWEVLDERVLGVMSTMPREVFVPDAYRGLAYADIEIPLGGGQQMLAPKVVGRLLQALTLAEGDRVLEIGTGSGYVVACLARLAGTVISLDSDPARAAQARALLATPPMTDAGPAWDASRIRVECSDGLLGDHDAPFDAIAVTGSLPTEEPLAHLREQLAEGGRLFAIVGTPPLMRALRIVRVRAGHYRRDGLFETCVPPLHQAPMPETFVF